MSVYNLPSAQKLQHDLHEIRQRVEHLEENVKYFKTLQSRSEKSIAIKQVALEEYDESRFSTRVNRNDDDVKSEEETTGHILKHEGSAAALLHSMKIQGKVLSSEHSITKDVVGIVAALGKVDDDNLSRLLAEYLGPEKMLAVVCKTYDGVKSLEAYNEEGLIDKNIGVHAFAATIGGSLVGRFDVICLERLRPYAGEFIVNDPQRRLSLQKPRLPNGESPPGFLGFAVNMITIDNDNLYCISKDGQGLRETLFYNIFLKLQVYRKREDMLNALSCINNGAISLDGGMIRTPGVFSLNHHRGDVVVRFLKGSESLNISEIYIETKNEMIKAQRKLDRSSGDLQREQCLLDNARLDYEKKKNEFLKFLAGNSSHVPQSPGE